MIILGITGHTNIEKAQGLKIEGIINKYDKDSYLKTMDEIEGMVKIIAEKEKVDIKDIIFVSGMARGADEIFAMIAIKYGASLKLAIPNSMKWHKNRDFEYKNNQWILNPNNGVRAQAVQYNTIVNYVIEKINSGDKNSEISEIKKTYGTGHKFGNFARNQYMVDVSTHYISFKKYNSTGTDDTIRRARKKGIYIGNVIDIGKEEAVKR